MIREFQFSDWEKLDCNEFSKPENIDFFDDDEYYFYTLEDDGIKGIICFKECGKDEYLIFSLISNNFTNKHSKHIKKFMIHCIDRLEAKTVFTVSRQCETVRRWHRFFGLKIEKEIEINNIKYDYWVL